MEIQDKDKRINSLTIKIEELKNFLNQDNQAITQALNDIPVRLCFYKNSHGGLF
jgi:hypothetical protein